MALESKRADRGLAFFRSLVPENKQAAFDSYFQNMITDNTAETGKTKSDRSQLGQWTIIIERMNEYSYYEDPDWTGYRRAASGTGCCRFFWFMKTDVMLEPGQTGDQGERL